MSNNANKMVYVDGSKVSFRCSCGCNVFHHPAEKPAAYECNACGAWYTGEDDSCISRED